MSMFSGNIFLVLLQYVTLYFYFAQNRHILASWSVFFNSRILQRNRFLKAVFLLLLHI